MKFIFYPQSESMDCGPACLRMIARYYGKLYSLDELRDKCYITKDGVSLLGISEAAESIGFRVEGVKLTWDQLQNVLLPCIVHWNQHHFVIVYAIKKKRKNYIIYVADPAYGLMQYNKDSFLKYWLTTNSDSEIPFGVALLLEPSPKFYQEQGNASEGLRFGYLLHYLFPYKRYIIQIFLGLVTGSIISIIFPFLTQTMVDVGIGDRNINYVILILLAQVMLTIGQTANELIRNWLMLHVTTRISITLISDFLHKLMRLPIAFFDSKRIGDIMQRIGDYNRIQSFLTGSVISIIMAVVVFLVYSGVMASYNWKILGIFILGSILYVGWVLLFLQRRRKIDYLRFQESANNQSNLVQLITGMQDIKLNNCERQKRWAWERVQIKLYKINIKGLALGQTQAVGGIFIDQTKNMLVSFLAASAVIRGDMTLGMMMALQYIMGQLNAPLSQFINLIQSMQDAKMSLDRLNEIYTREDEEPVHEERLKEIPIAENIFFKNVVFQYEGPHSSKVLNNINLSIPARKVTAIVGTSGSGKTTLLKLILGFYFPIDGEIFLGNIPLKKYNSNCWRRNCGVVMQDGFIFSDTIANNIAVSDETPDIEKIKEAAKIANLDDFISSLPLGYNTRIGQDGQGLSSGQRQRILIARVIYKRANYIFFDEATNALDANNEHVIMGNLEQFFRGRTVVVVAHRLSTVKNADKIVVLQEGIIVEEGTHKELIALKGRYFNLVKNQLELDF